jgi:hypothetical protein
MEEKTFAKGKLDPKITLAGGQGSDFKTTNF